VLPFELSAVRMATWRDREILRLAAAPSAEGAGVRGETNDAMIAVAVGDEELVRWLCSHTSPARCTLLGSASPLLWLLLPMWSRNPVAYGGVDAEGRITDLPSTPAREAVYASYRREPNMLDLVRRWRRTRLLRAVHDQPPTN
jgi:hypothetical protein